MMEIEDGIIEAGDGDGEVDSVTVVIDGLLEEAELARRVGDFTGAVAAFERIVEVDPDHTEARLAIAQIHLQSGRPQQALHWCNQILSLDSGHMGARVEMAEAMRLLGRNDDAHAIHELLVHERPTAPMTWCGLARLLADEGHLAAAETCLRRALALAPSHLPSLTALARHLAKCVRHDEAVDLFHDAIALDPDDPAHHAGMALSLMALGRMEEASLRIDRALALDDENLEARLARADLLVMTGRLAESWRDAEWRWLRPGSGRPAIHGLAWDGAPLNGASLLLFAENSLSDTLRMLRYVPLAARPNARLILVVQPGLMPLVTGMEGVTRVERSDRPLPLDVEADFVASLMDLPRLLDFDLEHMPEAPWLEPPPRRRRPILAPPDTALKVGIAWAGRDQAAAIPFPLFLPLAEIPGVVLFALEVSADADAAANLADPSLVTDLGPTIADYADLAGRIAELDVIVAADCPTAHLAGAMGKPVLVLIPADGHPRWMRDTERSPWYPTAQLLRRGQGEDWEPVLHAARLHLARLADDSATAQARLRFRAMGPAPAHRALLDAHLRPGDLLVDCQADDGDLIPERDDIEVLAIDPSPSRAAALREHFRDRPTIEVIEAALGRDGEEVLASAHVRSGRRVFSLPPGIPGHIATTSLDRLLAERPGFAARRLVVRVGQTGWEESVLAGISSRPADVILFEHRPGSSAAERAAEMGFSLWSFPTEVAFGPLAPFDQRPGTVLALAPGLEPVEHYGPATLPPSPAEIGKWHAEAERLVEDGVSLQGMRDLGGAAECYAKALIKDPFAPGANANKGVLMHMAGRRDAAIACYRRALTRVVTAGVTANLGNALRELHRYDEAEVAIERALDMDPDDPDFIYDLAMLRRDQGRLDEAARLLRRILDRRRGAEWSLAQVLMAAGETADGLALFRARPSAPPPDPQVPPWQGEDLMADNIMVYQDCDLADAILLSRFIPQIAARGGLVTVFCVPELEPLLHDVTGVEHVTIGDEPLPVCEYRVAMSQLPRLLHGATTLRAQRGGYLSVPDHLRPRRLPKDERLRVGLSWGGRPLDRACPLGEMIGLAADPELALTALVDTEAERSLSAIGAHTLVEVLAPPPADMAEAAAVIAGLDVVVGGDTPELHLAAAMGKPAWVLLPDAFTWRWPRGRDDSPWYPTARLFRQSPDGSWRHAVSRVAAGLKILTAKKRG
ncbi:hypothetical protein A6A04_10795 [Paramagnetospirillum marisnigri]|uniref:Peptide transporter n=1 Tax=Paramagnetospirillum marisnigri TaxID=1285242 RepID=A0A178MZP4_9PROT|nr:tetratricopeptide repeat protein [Paramagnetospirillum marisnigri]OAN56033.1 hypothetical protein A6A04_10795 [Paramagnetospirillum marisnigri]